MALVRCASKSGHFYKVSAQFLLASWIVLVANVVHGEVLAVRSLKLLHRGDINDPAESAAYAPGEDITYDENLQKRYLGDGDESFRLNRSVLPTHYDLEFRPHIYPGDDFGFDGKVNMELSCVEDSNVIVFHVDMIDIERESMKLSDNQGNSLAISHTAEDKLRQFYKVYPEQKLIKGSNYSLYMNFNGTTIHPDLFGFYRSKYTENGVEKWMVSTQFSMAYARRGFPVFDATFFKATFNVTMVRKKGYQSLSCGPLERTEPRDGDWEADTFGTTVKMSPYILAYIVHQFDYVESKTRDGVPIRIFAQSSMLKYTEYANKITGKVLQALADWTGIPYAMPKLGADNGYSIFVDIPGHNDMIVVPQFPFAAMENWGLVTYHENALLYNPKYSDIQQKNGITFTIAHELAHQWFGNLVTMDWWTDTFLKEAFASHLGSSVGIKLGAQPQWEVEEQGMTGFKYILDYDGNHYSQPIRMLNLKSQSDYRKAFSGITYRKGQNIVRMFRDFLGEETFHKGIQAYLRKFAYKTATAEGLYQVLEQQAHESGSVTWDAQKTNLSSILSSWMNQMNFPLVHVTDKGDGTLSVRQTHFLYDEDKKGSHPSPLGFLWHIPLTYMDNRLQPRMQWLPRNKQTQKISGLDATSWKLVNIKRMGFYRVMYDSYSWEEMMRQLEHNHTVFPVENRAGLIDDAFQLVRAGQFKDVDALKATRYLKNEHSYLPWDSFLRNSILKRYLDMFYSHPSYDRLQQYLIHIIEPVYKQIDWDVQEDAFINRVHPDLSQIVYCSAVAHGDKDDFDFLISQADDLLKSDDFYAYQKWFMYYWVNCPTTPEVVQRYIKYALEGNTSVPLSLSALGRTRAARKAIWEYVERHWEDLQKHKGLSLGGLLSAITSRWNTKKDLEKFDKFISEHDEKNLETTFKTIRATIKTNIAWMETHLEPIDTWLKSQDTTSEYAG